MLYIFDKDGTLVGGERRTPPNAPDEQIVLPGVREALAALKEAGHKVVIASNQGGVAWGFITYDDAEALMVDAARKVGGVDAYLFCPYDPAARASPRSNPVYATASYYRKPMPGMLIDLMRTFDIWHRDVWMIGDQDSDQRAAEYAGCNFTWSWDFFGWPPECKCGMGDGTLAGESHSEWCPLRFTTRAGKP